MSVIGSLYCWLSIARLFRTTDRGTIIAGERLAITLTPERLDFVRERTAGGDYNSDSEVPSSHTPSMTKH